MVLESTFDTNSEKVIGVLQDMLGANFRISGGGWSDIIIEVREGDRFVPLARVCAPALQDPTIFVREEAAILNTRGIVYIEYRSTYRRIANRLEAMNIGPVKYNR